VALHLSWELSQAEEEIRRTAEEIAILRADHDELSQRMTRLESESSRGSDAGVASDE
jgi:ubiquinone biosynthesis protein UbiJ